MNDVAKKVSPETARLKKLADYKILDTLPEQNFDDLTLIASEICKTPIVLISLIDENRQWFKSKIGIDAVETPRSLAFCDYAIRERETMIVEDARKDRRFAQNPYVVGEPNIRFYAGAPLWTQDGFCLGTLCVVDRETRVLAASQITALEALSRQVMIQLELRLQQAEAESARLLSGSIATLVPNDIYIYDLNQRRHVFTNRDIAARMGYAKDYVAALGERFWPSIIHPEDATSESSEHALIAGQMSETRESGVSEFTRRVQHANGEWRWMLHREVVFQRNQQGKPEQIIGIAQDVTDLKRKEEEIKSSEMKYRSLVGAATDAIIGSDGSGRIISWNQGAETIFGYTAEEVAGQSVSMLIPDQFKDVYHGVMENAQNFGRANGSVSEITGLKKDRTTIPIELAVSSWRQDGKIHFTSIIRDITSRLESSRVLKEFNKILTQKVNERTQQLEVLNAQVRGNEKQLQTIIANTPVILWAIDQNGICRIAEGNGLKDLGVDTSKIIGSSYRESMQGLPDVIKMIERAMKGESLTAVFEFSGKWFEAYFSPVEDNVEGAGGMVAVATDITSKIEADRLAVSERSAREASKLKSEFLANMSHEIRTPINGVMGMSELMMGTELTPEQREFAESIQFSAESLSMIINDILDFSKIEAGKLELEEVSFDLAKLLIDSRRALLFSANRKKISFEIESDFAQGDRIVRGDPGRIRQILTNLIGNAIKFTSVGGVVVRVIENIRGSESKYLRFEVEDTGIGIPPRAVESIFNPFTQADASTTRKYGGTGLGLSISQKLVGLMNGKIGVRSQEGTGSCFWFEIPLQNAEINTVLPKVSVDRRPVEANAAQILVVEDNLINQKVALLNLEYMGYHAVAASDGTEALTLLSQQKFDLVLMDCQMPGMDGYEATARIRQSSLTNIQKIPVIAMTANATAGDRERCLKAGMDDYISKPIHMATLAGLITKWLPEEFSKTAPSSAPPTAVTPAPKIASTPKSLPQNGLDLEALDQLQELEDGKDLPMLSGMIMMYQSMVPGVLARLSTAALDRDTKTMKEQAHFLKASSFALGLSEMGRFCQHIESLDHPSAGEASLAVERLKDSFKRGLAELIQEVERRKKV